MCPLCWHSDTLSLIYGHSYTQLGFLQLSNNYPNNNFGSSGDLPDYNDYTSGNSEQANPYEQSAYDQSGYDQSNGYGTPAYPSAPQYDSTPNNAMQPNAMQPNGMFGNDRPGAWKRFLGLIIDSLLVQILIGGIVTYAICGQELVDWFQKTMETGETIDPPSKLIIAQIIMVVVWLAYRVLMETKVGGTLGKMAIGARVVSADGQNVTASAALLRNSWYILTMALGFIPFVGVWAQLGIYVGLGISIGQNAQKQSATDNLAKAYVVNK